MTRLVDRLRSSVPIPDIRDFRFGSGAVDHADPPAGCWN